MTRKVIKDQKQDCGCWLSFGCVGLSTKEAHEEAESKWPRFTEPRKHVVSLRSLSNAGTMISHCVMIHMRQDKNSMSLHLTSTCVHYSEVKVMSCSRENNMALRYVR